MNDTRNSDANACDEEGKQNENEFFYRLLNCYAFPAVCSFGMSFSCFLVDFALYFIFCSHSHQTNDAANINNHTMLLLSTLSSALTPPHNHWKWRKRNKNKNEKRRQKVVWISFVSLWSFSFYFLAEEKRHRKNINNFSLFRMNAAIKKRGNLCHFFTIMIMIEFVFVYFDNNRERMKKHDEN